MPDAKQDPTEALLYLAQKRFRSLLKSLPVGVAIVRSNGTIEAVNVAIVKVFRYSEQELVGHNIAELMRKPPWSADSSLREWHLENPGRAVELEGLSQDQELVPIDFSVHQLDADTRERLVVVMADVTERFLANKLKHDFFQMINHDIRSPLSSIVMFLKIMASRSEFGVLTDAGRDRLTIAERNVERILSMVQELLDLDTLESSVGNLNKQPLNLRELLQNSAALVREAALSKNFQIEVQCEEATIEGDYQRLEQVLVNLLSNGIGYSAPGLPMTLTSTRCASMIRIEIRDHGPGISADDKKVIFDKFKQGSQKKAGGFGLGLAICKEIVRQHDGKIGCDDAPGGGTIFWFEIPAMDRTPVCEI